MLHVVYRVNLCLMYQNWEIAWEAFELLFSIGQKIHAIIWVYIFGLEKMDKKQVDGHIKYPYYLSSMVQDFQTPLKFN